MRPLAGLISCGSLEGNLLTLNYLQPPWPLSNPILNMLRHTHKIISRNWGKLETPFPWKSVRIDLIPLLPSLGAGLCENSGLDQGSLRLWYYVWAVKTGLNQWPLECLICQLPHICCFLPSFLSWLLVTLYIYVLKPYLLLNVSKSPALPWPSLL